LGAAKPEEYGDYYAWGETEPYYSSLDPLTWKEGYERGYYWPSYKWCYGSSETMTKYCNFATYGYNGFTDGKTILDLEDDAAHVILRGNWRMPTQEEWADLKAECTWTWTSQNGVYGRLVTASNGNSIFLPAAGHLYGLLHSADSPYGYYWSSTLNSNIPSDAWNVCFFSDGIGWGSSNNYRVCGFSIRPVYAE
jgi:hypothetical protein